MADPIAVIIRFSGDRDDLLERFDRVRQKWIEAQEGDYERPIFYAACKADEGIAIVSGWQTAVAHRAFGEELHAHSPWAWARRIKSSGCGSGTSAGTEARQSPQAQVVPAA